MLALKILGVFLSFLLIHAMPTLKKDEENGKNTLSYRNENFEVSRADGYKNIAGRDYDGKTSAPTIYGRSPYQMSSSRPTNSSAVYIFDYLIKDPEKNLHFHIQQKHENGTVGGYYGYGENHDEHAIGFDRNILVTYVADAGGYRANARKVVLGGSLGMFGLGAERINGKLHYSFWEIKSVAASVRNFYTSGADPNSDEDDDSYRSDEE